METQQEIDDLRKKISLDIAGAMTVAMGCIGDKCGLFKALGEHGPCSASVLARHCGLNERYVLEWLKGVTAMSYAQYNPSQDVFFLTEAQKQVLVDEDNPHTQVAYFQFATNCILAMPHVIEKGFHQGTGVSPEFFAQNGTYEAIRRMHASFFKRDLVQNVLMPIPGMAERLAGPHSRVLDVGCGMGEATVAMARGFPAATCVGVDLHQPSVAEARRLAKDNRITNAVFECFDVVSYAANQDSGKFDLVLAYDCIHDMVDPLGTLVAMRQLLRDSDSVVVWSEPVASTNPLENRDPKSVARCGFNVLHCMTISLSSGGAGLGSMMGLDRAKDLASQAGYGSFAVLPSSTASQYFFALHR